MTKTILITGATDGIGFETAKLLRAQGHNLLLHGRSAEKLERAYSAVEAISGGGRVATYRADLSSLAATAAFARDVLEKETALDVVINNAGVFRMSNPATADGLDARFAVNTIAPYILARALAPLIGKEGRIVNLSSAAQSPVVNGALEVRQKLTDNAAYGQSKLALTMWTRQLADEWGSGGPTIVAVNPGSFLASKMVKEAYGMQGKDLSIGAEILTLAATAPEFGHAASGRYFDNDSGRFGNPHPDALDPAKNAAVVERMDAILGSLGL